MSERPSKINLWKAVLAFQAKAPALQKDKLNPAFRSKYLSLDKLMEQVVPLLNECGLIWVTIPNQKIVTAGGEARVEPDLSYRLIHAESGEETSGTVPLILGKRDMQGLGSAVTYARRYALMSVLGLVADEDDDGAKASRPAKAQARSSNGGAARLLTAEELNRMLAKIDESGKDKQLLFSAVGLEGPEGVTVAHAKQIAELIA